MNIDRALKNLVKLSTLAFIGAAISMPAQAQISDRMKSAKPMAQKAMKAAPCVNSMEPCGGQIFTLDVQKARSLKLRDRELKKYVMRQMQEQHPEASEEMLEGNAGIILALLAAREVLNAEDIEMELIKWPPKITLEIKFVIKFGK